MSQWLQAGIAISIALASLLWIFLSRNEQVKPDGKHIGWMPIALFVVLVLYCVVFTLLLNVQFAWIFVALVVAVAVLFRFVGIPRLQETPDGKQALIEASVKKVEPVNNAKPARRAKWKKFFQKGLFLASLWFAFGRILTAIYGTYSGSLEVALFPPTINVFGYSVSQSTVITWGIIAALAVFALIFRIFIVPRFKDNPGFFQHMFEASIESIEKFAHGQMHTASESLTCYMFTIAALMICSAFVELLGLRAPTADLILTASMALVTFVMINYYGFRRKGFIGRIKSLAQPSWAILPIRLMTDLAIPISLSCRLFGNMMGGMIVMDLLAVALGNNAIGIPPIAGLYFNIFHPLIQAYIFITLSLTFINEATE